MAALIRLTVITILSSLFLFTSCTTIVRKKPPIKSSVKARKKFERIQIHLAVKNKKKAIRQLKQIIAKNPDSDIVDDSYLLMGDIYYKMGKFQRAFDSYMSVSQSEFFSPREGDSILLACKSLAKLGRNDEALALSLKALNVSPKDSETTVRIYQFRFTLLSQFGDHLDALETLVGIINSSPSQNIKKAYKDKALDYLDSHLQEKNLETVGGDKDFGEIQAYALYRLGTQKFEEKDFQDAKSYLEDVVSLLPDSDIGEQSEKILRQIEAQRKVNPTTIGAVLPLSGRHSNVAYRTLRGLQLGLGIYGKNKSNFRLAVIDSEGNPDVARRAVERLVIEDHVIAIVGSLLSKTSIAVASKADELGVPSIALSQKSGITDVGDTVFRNALTSGLQIRHLVKTAMDDYGLTKFAILYPNDRYGVEYANLFWNEVLARGGEIRAAQTYDGKKKIFAGPIQRLVGTFYLEDRKEEYKYNLTKWLETQKVISRRISPPNELLPPVIDFEGLFIPDTIKMVELIAPSLAFHEVSNVKLLGTNLWNNQRLTRRSRQFVEGSLFVDSLLSTDMEFKGSPFYKEYRSIFGSNPGVFEAQAYDAGLILRQIISAGESSRIGLSEQLAGLSDFPGSLGNLIVSTRREIIRPVVSLEVSEGSIKPVGLQGKSLKK